MITWGELHLRRKHLSLICQDGRTVERFQKVCMVAYTPSHPPTPTLHASNSSTKYVDMQLTYVYTLHYVHVRAECDRLRIHKKFDRIFNIA